MTNKILKCFKIFRQDMSRKTFCITFFLAFITASCLFADCFQKKTHYLFTKEPIDVVIPCCEKDLYTLDLCIKGIRQNGKNIRRIIVVSDEPFSSQAEWFDEKNFPFSKKDLAVEIFHNNKKSAEDFLASPRSRIGWIYQQFLKLYAYFVIPDISSNILILDSDTIFLNPTEFTNAIGEPYFTTDTENVGVYFDHGKRLLPGFKRVNKSLSGIANHMLFQGCILEDLFDQIYQIHHEEPWKAICRCIDTNYVYSSCLSEYEIYFNFALLRTDQAHPRTLIKANVSSLDRIENFRKEKYSYISCHEWMRPRNAQHQ